MKNNYKINLIIAFSFLTIIIKAQVSISHQWSFNPKNSVPQGSNVDNRGIVKDPSGNIYVTGWFSNTADFDPSAGINYLTSNGGTDFYLAKYTSVGSLVWAKNIGGYGNDQAYAIDIDNSGNVYLTGYYNSTVDFDPNAGVQNRTALGNGDIFVAKYDANGNYMFALSCGGTLADNSNAIAISGTNVYVTGSFNGTADLDPSAATQTFTAVGGSDAFILKLDLNGNYINAISFGGVNTDTGNGITFDGASNVYIAGTFFQSCDFDPSAATQLVTGGGLSDAFYAKYNTSLNYVYAFNIGGTGSDFGNAISIDATGNAYVAGNFANTADFDPSASTQTLTSNGIGDVFFAKYDNVGSYVYAKSFGGTTSDNAWAIETDAATNVYLTGPFYGTVDFDPGVGTQTVTSGGGADIYIAKYDASGNYVFANTFGVIGTDIGFGLYYDGTDIYASGQFGQTVDFDPSAASAPLTAGGSYNNVYFARYSSTGAYSLAKHIGDVSTAGISETAQAVTRDASGNVYVTGQFSGTVDFDPSAATQTLTSAGSIDAFIAKYDAAGNYIWAQSIGGTGSDFTYDIKIDASNNIYVTGSFNSSDCDFDPTAATATLATNGNYDPFVAKYTPAGNYMYAFNFGGTGDDRGMSITADASGNTYVAGYANGTVDFDPSASTATFTSAGGNDFFFAKYNATGNYVVAALIGGTSTESATGIEVDGSGNIYVGGSFNNTVDFDPSAATLSIPSAGSTDVFFAKYSSTGTLVFAKNIGGSSADAATDMVLDASGDIYIAGYFGNANTDFDPNAGVQYVPYAGGSADIYFAKYSNTGNYVYAKGLSGTGFEGVGNIFVDGSSNIYITGYFAGTVDFDPGAAVANRISAGGNDVYIGKYDINGDYLYNYSFGTALPDVGYAVTADGTGNVYMVGTFNTAMDLDPNIGISNVTSFNSQDMFVAKYTECTAVTTTISNQTNVLCNGGATGSATVTAIGGSGITYTWMPSGGNSNTASGLTAGNYSLIAQNSCGSSSTQTVAITQPSVVSITTVPSATTAICALNSLTLSSSATGGTGVITYTWTGIGSTSSVVVNPSTSTVYSVTATDANNCTANTTVSVTVNANPTVTAVSSTSLLCTGQQATLTAGGALTYTWSTTSNNATIAITPTTTTSYTLIGTDANGCVNNTIVTQTVSLCTGINMIAANDFTVNVYPNPTSGVFQVSLNSVSQTTTIKVYNQMGQLVVFMKPEGLNTSVNISELSSGIYFVRLEDNGVESLNYKIIKN